jgi:uncharacterized protein YycO
MNGAEILKKYYADYDSGHTVMLSEMIDIAIAEATKELRVDLKDEQAWASDYKKQLDTAQQQLLERDAMVEKLDQCMKNPFSSRACERGTKSCTIYHTKPSEAMRLHDEQIKKEAQEKCAEEAAKYAEGWAAAKYILELKL